ncbi:hypothetical protein PAMP_021740 [Pampus punctatissimus]
MPSSSSSSHSSSSAYSMLPVALGPVEAPTTFTTSSFSSSHRPSPPRGRRPRRVLYPASQSRRPPLREAPDQALRWLLLLSALVFLQIYTEETYTCTELQSQSPDMVACQHQDGEGSSGTARRWTGEEPWGVQTVGGASETHLECVVA